MEFKVAPSPHSPPTAPVPVIMRRVLYALTPAAIVYVWFFGTGFIVNLVVASVTAVLAEGAVLKLRGRSTRHSLRDGSALVTATLLTFAIPPFVPWWIPAIGSAAAIVIAKQLYGGLGKNFFNPAMVGYVLLLVSFPVEMTQWVPPRMGDIDYQRLTLVQNLDYSLTGRLPAELAIDSVTRATPLDLVREGVRAGQPFAAVRGGSLFGDFGGRGWEWVGNFIALGGLYLLYMGVIRWHIPVAMLAGVLVPATILHFIDAARFAAPGFHFFSGATLLGAFFIATDPVSAAATARGRLIFGASIGLLTYAIRTWGGYPDGVAFAVLLMNAAVPLIDRYTRPRIYGRV